MCIETMIGVSVVMTMSVGVGSGISGRCGGVFGGSSIVSHPVSELSIMGFLDPDRENGF